MNLPTSAACHDVPQATIVTLSSAASSSADNAHLVQEHLRRVHRHAAEDGLAQRVRLLDDLLEHEVLVAGLLGHDGIPGDARRHVLAGRAVDRR